MSARRVVYWATSWRNSQSVRTNIEAAREQGHEVYDFTENGFGWDQVGGAPSTPDGLIEALESGRAREAFARDMAALAAADTLVLQMPAGLSAGIETGRAMARGLDVHVLLGEGWKAELMVSGCAIHPNLDSLLRALDRPRYAAFSMNEFRLGAEQQELEAGGGRERSDLIAGVRALNGTVNDLLEARLVGEMVGLVRGLDPHAIRYRIGKARRWVEMLSTGRAPYPDADERLARLREAEQLALAAAGPKVDPTPFDGDAGRRSDPRPDLDRSTSNARAVLIPPKDEPDLAMPNLINSDPLRQICLALARLGTADPGERSAAARQARDLARAAGLTLDQALDRLAQPQPAPARRPEPADGMDAYVPQERLGHILAEFQLSRVKRQVAPPPPAAPPRRAAAPAAPSTIRLGGRDWPVRKSTACPCAAFRRSARRRMTSGAWPDPRLQERLDLPQLVESPEQSGPDPGAAAVVIGFDSEYTASPTGGLHDVVSLQLVSIDPKFELLIPIANGAERRHRPTLAAALSAFFREAIAAKVISEQPDKIILAAHWSRADLPSLRDFPKLKRQVDSPESRTRPCPARS